MNRAAHLYRPAPTVTDLSGTAEGMVRSANLKGYLQALARAYFEVYRRQIEWGQEDFWGLREFYSTIRSINRQLKRSQGGALDAATVMNAVQRNFGGRPEVVRAVLSVFFESLSMSMPEDSMAQHMVCLIWFDRMYISTQLVSHSLMTPTIFVLRFFFPGSSGLAASTD
jgi:hypothetical protein